MHIRRLTTGRGALCRSILAELPEWFGIPEAVERYACAADALPVWAAADPACDAPDGARRYVGYLALRTHFETAVEIDSMGVRRAWRGRGVGRRLIAAAADQGRAAGARFLTVKTLSAARPDPNYAATRAFYARCGFLPLEEFPTLWGAANPCLLMIRDLAAPPSGAPFPAPTPVEGGP